MPSVSDAVRPAGIRAAAPHRLADPALWLFGALSLLLAFLVANPILRLIWDSFLAADGSLTLSNYVLALGRSRHLQALLNSLMLGAAVTLLALALGGAARARGVA